MQAASNADGDLGGGHQRDLVRSFAHHGECARYGLADIEAVAGLTWRLARRLAYDLGQCESRCPPVAGSPPHHA